MAPRRSDLPIDRRVTAGLVGRQVFLLGRAAAGNTCDRWEAGVTASGCPILDPAFDPGMLSATYRDDGTAAATASHRVYFGLGWRYGLFGIRAASARRGNAGCGQLSVRSRPLNRLGERPTAPGLARNTEPASGCAANSVSDRLRRADVMNRSFIDGPPKAQLVTRDTGRLIW
jgi:hypothetical protein